MILQKSFKASRFTHNASVEQRRDRMESLLEKDLSDWEPSERRRYDNESGLREALSDTRATLNLLLAEKAALRQEKAALQQKDTFLRQEKAALNQRVTDAATARSLVTVPVEKDVVKVHQLVETSGSKFEFVDRQESFDSLARAIEKRLASNGAQDRNLHPIPFLADGPGTGKSRFLDETSKAFKTYVDARKSTYPLLANSLTDALFIRVTFGNGSVFRSEEVEFGISKALAIRMLDPYFENARKYINTWKSDGDSVIEHALKLLMSKRKRTSSIFLCVDEVNKMHSLSPRLFKELFNVLGSMSCSHSPFLVPILAGTVIGPIEEVVSESSHPPLHIPLPLLSYDSSLKIVSNNSGTPESNRQLMHLVGDMGGHPRALEFLFDSLPPTDLSTMERMSMDWVECQVRVQLKLRYNLTALPIEGAIATAFLSLDVMRNDPVPGVKDITFLTLAEKGVVKLKEAQDGKVKVYVPYVFVCASLLCRSEVQFPVVKLWKELLLDQNFWWQDWEVFNRNYFAFRLSLYSYLGYKTLSLGSFFTGAKCNLPSDINFVVPPIEEVQVIKANSRFPNTMSEVKSNVFSLNAAGAPFDAFVLLDTVDKKRILVAFQMKFGGQDAKAPTKAGKDAIKAEYDKTEKAMNKFLPGTKFVLVFLSNHEKAVDFTDADIPSGCILVTKDEQRALYGELYYRRLKRL